jgi:hypothetical protein
MKTFRTVTNTRKAIDKVTGVEHAANNCEWVVYPRGNYGYISKSTIDNIEELTAGNMNKIVSEKAKTVVCDVNLQLDIQATFKKDCKVSYQGAQIDGVKADLISWLAVNDCTITIDNDDIHIISCKYNHFYRIEAVLKMVSNYCNIDSCACFMLDYNDNIISSYRGKNNDVVKSAQKEYKTRSKLYKVAQVTDRTDYIFK